MSFEARYNQLNDKQRQAVDTIDGPVMVMAGPGTGKTELLAMRVANILAQTDTLPDNILCLTFTESGARNMRERLSGLIGQAAYKVNISTYHGFGGELIRRFPDYFSETRLQEPVDELGRRQILAAIVDKMSYANPLKQSRYYLRDLISTISDAKRALLTSSDLRAIASENSAFIQGASRATATIFADMPSGLRKAEKALPYHEKTLHMLRMFASDDQPHAHIASLHDVAAQSLEDAIRNAQEMDSTKPLTEWRNKWLKKDVNNAFVFGGQLENSKIAALANVMDEYQEALEYQGLYDFDDMIIRSIGVLEQNDDLKYTLQEQYQYLLLDEFQDTNAVQLRLVQLLSDNPVHEGRPNVLAVGDDDQAIYAFQGAQYSNMHDFYTMYRDVTLINLSENYRSHADILLTARNVAEQIRERLHHKFDGFTKELTAANRKLPAKAQLSRNEFLSDIAQYDWVARQVQALIKQKVEPKEIAILAPRHKYLEPLVPFLNELGIPVRYEKRENILDAPVVRQLLSMSQLVLAIRDGDHDLAASLWPEVLSFDFWKIPTDKIWQLSWKVDDSHDETYTWNKAVLEEECCREPALLLLALAGKVEVEPLEVMLDWLIGSSEVETHDPDQPQVRSPLREFYSGETVQRDNPQLFYETLSHLKVLRDKLREFESGHDGALMLDDLLAFVEMYDEAEEQMINTSPYNQDANAVQIMTVFKAKGLEYEHVFLVGCSDDIWGASARGNTNKIGLPVNLAPIRHAGSTDDERLRILFVALTRAKIGLYLTSYTGTYTGKETSRLSYLDEQEQPDGSFDAMVLPEAARRVHTDTGDVPPLEHMELDWHDRHLGGTGLAQLRALLEDRLASYKLSPTHLNSFVDLKYSGPQAFFYKTILRFPDAPTLDSQFGNAMHATMQWVQQHVDRTDSVPPVEDTVLEFERQLKKQRLPKLQEGLELERGEKALSAYLTQRAHMFKPGDKAEYNFSGEAVLLGDVHMSGKIDRMEIDSAKKEIVVVDYKTGDGYDRWKSDAKLHKYRQQLYCYKLLIENSRAFHGYTVTAGRLEFLEPDENGRVQSLTLEFKEKELEETKALLTAVWKHIHELSFPDVSDYDVSLTGIKQFEADLLIDKI